MNWICHIVLFGVAQKRTDVIGGLKHNSKETKKNIFNPYSGATPKLKGLNARFCQQGEIKGILPDLIGTADILASPQCDCLQQIGIKKAVFVSDADLWPLLYRAQDGSHRPTVLMGKWQDR